MTTPAPAHRGFLRSAGVVSALTLLSRVLGLVRDMATGHVLGNSAVNDALTLAWTLPNLFRRLFGEGALSSAFVPVFTRVLDERGTDAARRVANAVISALGLVLVAVVLVLVAATWIVPDGWVVWLAGEQHADKIGLTLHYTRLLLPYLAVICVVAQFMAVLNSVGEFAVPATSPVLLNVLWIVGIGVAAWWAVGADGSGDSVKARQGTIIALSILAAAVVQIVWHLPALAARGVPFRPTWPRGTPEVGEVAGLMLPMLLGVASAQVNIIADRTIAFRALPDGGVSHLYYAMRLMQFPLGLVSAALVTTVFPTLSSMMVRGDRGQARDTASFALRTNLLVSIPAAVGLAVLAEPIVRLLFEHGEFDATGTRATSAALVGYAIGIPFVGSVMLLTRVCYAAGDVRLPVRIGVATVGLNVALDVLLVGPFAELGLAAATSITALANTVLLVVGVRGRLDLGPGQHLLAGSMPSVVLGAVLAGAVFLVDGALAGRWGAGRTDAAVRVVAGVVTGGAVFLALAPRLCREEWAEVSGLLRRRARRD